MKQWTNLAAFWKVFWTVDRSEIVQGGPPGPKAGRGDVEAYRAIAMYDETFGPLDFYSGFYRVWMDFAGGFV